MNTAFTETATLPGRAHEDRQLLPDLKVFGKDELVRMLTQKYDKTSDWLEIAKDPARSIAIPEGDMHRAYAMISTFRASRISYNRQAFEYYRPAFEAIEEAVITRDFQAFQSGCKKLLGLMAYD